MSEFFDYPIQHDWTLAHSSEVLAEIMQRNSDPEILADSAFELGIRGLRHKSYVNYSLGNTASRDWGSVSVPAKSILPGNLSSDHVRNLMKHPAAKVRKAVVYLAGEWSGLEIIDDLTTMLIGPNIDSDHFVRNHAALAMALIGSEKSLNALELAILEDPQDRLGSVRANCLSALHIMLQGDPLFVLPVLSRLTAQVSDELVKIDLNHMLLEAKEKIIGGQENG
jgi:hypothetical protein